MRLPRARVAERLEGPSCPPSWPEASSRTGPSRLFSEIVYSRDDGSGARRGQLFPELWRQRLVREATRSLPHRPAEPFGCFRRACRRFRRERISARSSRTWTFTDRRIDACLGAGLGAVFGVVDRRSIQAGWPRADRQAQPQPAMPRQTGADHQATPLASFRDNEFGDWQVPWPNQTVISTAAPRASRPASWRR